MPRTKGATKKRYGLTKSKPRDQVLKVRCSEIVKEAIVRIRDFNKLECKSDADVVAIAIKELFWKEANKHWSRDEKINDERRDFHCQII